MEKVMKGIPMKNDKSKMKPGKKKKGY